MVIFMIQVLILKLVKASTPKVAVVVVVMAMVMAMVMVEVIHKI